MENMNEMDNQQPSVEKIKVQRLSRKRVLNRNVWETPPNLNKFYVYNLKCEKGNLLYIGSTNDPERRLSHHVCNSSDHNKSKNDYIENLYNNNSYIIMNILNVYENYDEALTREEELIINEKPLLNIILNKIYYLYNLETEEILEFKQLKDLAEFLNYCSIGLSHVKILRGRYLFSTDDNFENLINDNATIKLVDKNNNIKYAVNYQHAAWLAKCSVSMINLCLMKLRKSCKGYNIYHINDVITEFKERSNKKVKCLNDNKVFNSLKECSKFYNIDNSTLTKVCKNSRKTIKGLKFIYFDDIVQP